MTGIHAAGAGDAGHIHDGETKLFQFGEFPKQPVTQLVGVD